MVFGICLFIDFCVWFLKIKNYKDNNCFYDKILIEVEELFRMFG